ncbi:MAG: pyridoxal phosphate-dependent aminotransferase [Deltaproteobacteria bacterium]|nr:pyridoxal phosphate-dependent aminotransferase [Deltaproteobacteria bacterium]
MRRFPQSVNCRLMPVAFSSLGMFSRRTNWDRQRNRLAELLEARREEGRPVYDLTLANPTELGIEYPAGELLSALSNPQALRYQPDPKGLLSGREAVCQYYREKGIRVDPSRIFLTAGTSEAYSLIFKLLCNAGESVVVPKPSYPLLDYLAQVSDVNLGRYHLHYDHEWHLNVDHESAKGAKAIVVVNPHNPTGAFLKRREHRDIVRIAQENRLALIADEVFIDYPLVEDDRRFGSTAGDAEALTFTLNGLSKLAGLPQMKLGWIVLAGPPSLVTEAMERLEILCDTFLSVNSPVQLALPELMRTAGRVRSQILQRVKSNCETLRKATLDSPCSVLNVEGGWYAILRVPQIRSDEEWAIQLLEQTGVYLFPGYFFDFVGHKYLVVSLLPDEQTFTYSVHSLVSIIEQSR